MWHMRMKVVARLLNICIWSYLTLFTCIYLHHFRHLAVVEGPNTGKRLTRSILRSVAHMADPAEPVLKRQKTIGTQTFDEARQGVLKECDREEMLEGIFDAWDYDGNGSLTLEEILPFYMKSSKANDVLEPQVRTGFEKFCTSQGLQATDGLTKSAFKTWLSKLTNEQLASHFVRVKGWTSEAYKMNLNLTIVKDYRGKTIKEILDSPVTALRGLSDIGEEALQKLGVKTVREVAAWKPFLLARAIVTLAPTESTDMDTETAPAGGGISKKMNIRNMLDKEFEALPLKQVPDLPVSALSILPPECVEVLHTMRIRTIKHLGQRKYFHWANSMLELEQYEAWGVLHLFQAPALAWYTSSTILLLHWWVVDTLEGLKISEAERNPYPESFDWLINVTSRNFQEKKRPAADASGCLQTIVWDPVAATMFWNASATEAGWRCLHGASAPATPWYGAWCWLGISFCLEDLGSVNTLRLSFQIAVVDCVMLQTWLSHAQNWCQPGLLWHIGCLKLNFPSEKPSSILSRKLDTDWMCCQNMLNVPCTWRRP